MTPPTTRADLTDEDSRAIARAARVYFASFTPSLGVWTVRAFDGSYTRTFEKMREADDHVELLNGLAAVAEYKRRAAMKAAGE